MVRLQRVELLDIQPRLGPRSGGTLVTLTGQNLHVGSNVTVTLGGLPCPVISRPGSVTCVTSPSVEPRKVTDLRLRIDQANRSLEVPYTYTPGKIYSNGFNLPGLCRLCLQGNSFQSPVKFHKLCSCLCRELKWKLIYDISFKLHS